MPFIERLRDEMRVPIVYVSHSLAEVSRLATDIVVLAQGRVAAAGPAEAVIQGPAFAEGEERHEAGALLAMTVAAYDETFDMTTLSSAAGEARVPGRIAAPGRAVRLSIRARDVMVATEKPRSLSALNIFAGTVTAIDETLNASCDVRIAIGDEAILARITRQSRAALGLKAGMQVFAVVKSVSVETPGLAPASEKPN
jgi:molybdate transport system ATP-binding protein